jgi:hypothetical protein
MTSPNAAAGRYAVWRESREVLAILLAGLAVCFLLDALVFRTRFYTRILDPHTSTGSFEFTLSNEAAREYWARPVLILGDSIMVQGFSPRLANWLQQAHGYQFSSAAMPGTRERVWYYLLRDLDPSRTRYSVIVIPMESYDDRDLHEEDPADHFFDPHFVAVRLRLTDVPAFAASFHRFGLRLEAARATLLKGFVYRNDVQAFLAHPRQRIADVRQWRRDGDWEAYTYDGIGRSLAGLIADWNTGTILFPTWVSDEDKQVIRTGLLEPVPPQRGYLGEYRRRWLGRIVERYQRTATTILFLREPFNALQRRYVPPEIGHSAVHEFALLPGVSALDEHAFDEFERPEFFYDLHHLNAAGRARFTTKFTGLFAQTIKDRAR